MAKAKRKPVVDIETVVMWNKHTTAERERLAHEYQQWIRSTSLFQPALPVPEESAPVRLIVAHNVDPIDHRKDASKFNFVLHSALLEQWWPGCSVMWDAHPTLRYWSRYELRVVVNYSASQVTQLVRVPFGGEVISALPLYGQPGHAEYDRVYTPREALKAAREAGAFMLVAYELQPLAGRHRWSQARLAVALEAGLAVTVPRRAIFNPQEDPPRWTLIT